ncbi:PQQ-binding-like beta-propeller repeat protein [Halorubrum aquaticum]|uniref:PQQ-binding-like beta-propeller repeat protein n=1 Tax=Halorubrum aquaticum TaxID=387340 RepID=UPI00165F0599|nr:PQQ-binding-like beta-propeller repeat protein [Halorubrum aquaticum]
MYAGGLVLDGETGQRIGGEWGGHTSTPTVADGTLFVPTFDLEGRDAATGELDWTFEPDSRSGGLGGVTVANETAYVLGKLGRPLVYAIDVGTGEEEWRWTPDRDEVGSIRSPLAVADDTVYLVDEDGTVCAIDGETGDEEWRRPTFVRTSGSPVVVDGTVYFGSRDGEATALRAEDGEPRWRTRLSHESEETVAATPDAVFAAGADGTVTRLSTVDGTIEWERQFDDVRRLGSPTVAGDTVYVGSRSDGTVLALTAADGTENWRVETRSVLFGDYTRVGVVDGPAVVDGVVYVATEPGDVYAIAEL